MSEVRINGDDGCPLCDDAAAHTHHINSMPDPAPPAAEVLFDYVNHRGVQSRRRVRPERLYFGMSEWHPGRQWLLDAYDFDRGETRTFAMCNVTDWRQPSL